MRPAHFAFALLFLIIAPTVEAFEYDAYKPAELATVAPAVERAPGSELHIYLDAAHPRYRTTVRFTGKVRELSDEKRTFIRYWVKAMRHPVEYESLFGKEVETIQGGRNWWLPIQGSLVGAFLQEVAAGAEVELFVLLMGAVNQDAVFGISEFNAMPNPSLKRSANGMPPGPATGYGVHFPAAGPGVLPLSPA